MVRNRATGGKVSWEENEMLSGIVAKRALQDYENERRAIVLLFWFNATTNKNITSYYLLNAYFMSVPGRGLCNVLPNSIFLTTHQISTATITSIL